MCMDYICLITPSLPLCLEVLSQFMKHLPKDPMSRVRLFALTILELRGFFF